MRNAARAAALVCAALLAIPVIGPPPLGPWPGLALVAAAAGAVVLRSHALAATAGALVVSGYAVRLLLADARPGASTAIVGVGLLVLLELLDLGVASPAGPVERVVARRRALWIVTVAFVGAAAALTAQALGSALDARHPLLFVVSAVCGAGALALIASLTRRAVSPSG